MPVSHKKSIPLILWLLMAAALAAPPLWWSQGNPPVLDPSAAQNNHGPATIGQAKWMVSGALDTLDGIDPQLALAIRDKLTNPQPNPNNPGHLLPAIIDLRVPADPKPQEWIESQKAPLLIGQLKAISAPFYEEIHAVCPEWLEAELVANHTKDKEESENFYPWTRDLSDDSNCAVANIGQLKAVFSLLFDTLPHRVDEDGDGIPSLWEIKNGLDQLNPNDASKDNDNDGLSNLREFMSGTDPNSADTDGDGISDGWEAKNGLNPIDPGDAGTLGPVNLDFNEVPTISPDFSFRETMIPYPSDLYHQDGIAGWQACEGEYIEVWDEGDGNPYIELQGHFGGHGVKQEFKLMPGRRLNFLLRYKGRYDDYCGNNAFTLKVEGAADMLVDDSPASEVEGGWQKAFMETDDWEGNGMWAEWHYASISISTAPDTSDPENNDPVSITLSLVPTTTTGYGWDGEEHITYGGFVDILPATEFVTDWNRDGMIGEDDRHQDTQKTPFFFWVNNDNDGDETDEYRDLPGSNIDNADLAVNSRRDLVDFFPVQLRIEKLLEIFPPADYDHIIDHPDGAFHFIELPDIQPDSSPDSLGAGSYLRKAQVSGDAVSRTIKDTAGDGSTLSEEFLGACREGRGIVIFECIAKTQKSPRYKLKNKRDGRIMTIMPRALYVEMDESPLEFVHQLDLTPAADGYAVPDPIPPANTDFFDSRIDRWFVMAHGYNVNPRQSKALNSEIFKRMWHVGFNAKYVAVTWKGDVSQLPLVQVSPDYWNNVYNAFASSSPLAHKLNELTGSSKDKTVVAAHSLGNMLMSSAIHDHGLQAEQYFMINSAVAKEAYVPAARDQEANLLSHPECRNNHAPMLWASNWFQLFDDARNELTWSGRFEGLKDKTLPTNYYSTGEGIAMESDGSLPIEAIRDGKGAWVAQEMFKGSMLQSVSAGWDRGTWESHGGWGHNPNPPDLNQSEQNLRNMLKTKPFFDPFTRLDTIGGGTHANPAGTSVIDPNQGAALADEYSVRAWLLAYEIPALSNPAASGELAPYCESLDMQKEFNPNRIGWNHGAFHIQDFEDVYQVYESWQEKGKFDK